MENNSSQGGVTPFNNDSLPIIHAPYGGETWGPDGKGNMYYHEASAAPMKSRVLRVSEDGICTEYINLSRETKAGDKLKDSKNDVCILLDAVKGKIIIYAEKGSVDIRARENINLYAEKGNINFHAPNGHLMLSGKEIRTGDLATDPITGSKGKKPKIMMNSKSGGNFCGALLPHKFCWDFIGELSVPIGDNLSTLSNRVSRATRGLTAAAAASVGGVSEYQSAINVKNSLASGTVPSTSDLIQAIEPTVLNPIDRPITNPDICRAWQELDRKCSPVKSPDDSGDADMW